MILARLVIASYLSIDRHVTMSPVRRFPESFSYFGQQLRILVLTNLSFMVSFVAELYLLHMQEHLLDKKNKYTNRVCPCRTEVLCGQDCKCGSQSKPCRNKVIYSRKVDKMLDLLSIFIQVS